MCGIVGAIWNDPSVAISEDLLRKMTDAVRHRGPDDDGLYHSEYRVRAPYEPLPGVALGFRRLSIIDLEGGAQPMTNEDESIWVVFNGEIYNFETLRNRLEGAGHKFRTQSDTETIVHLYEDEGPNCFEHLNGMFAIAIWDANRRRLVLGRDRIGQKPLVYRQEANRLLFASELKSLLAVPGVPREIDACAIDEYLTYQYVPHPNSILKGFRKLPPGHSAVYEEGRLKVQPYWKPDFNHEVAMSAEEAKSQLRPLLESAVKMRMRSDVPLGAFLSGGVDSSLIVALMAKNSDQKIKTFSIGFPVKEFDETRYARLVADHIGTDHHEFQVTPDAMEVLPKLVWHYDEPFADSSAIPTWYVSKLTREHVTVSLTGDGGDELFSGYPRYKAIWLADILDRFGPLNRFLSSPLWQRLPSSTRQKSLLRRVKRFAGALALPAQRRYLDWIGIYNETARARLYSDDFIEGLADSDPFAFLNAAWSRASKRDYVTAASMTDLVTYMPCDLMTKVDIASMAHSLECRQPMLDHRLVEFAARMPLRWKFRRGHGKLILRDTFGDLLPGDIWTRKKMGFGVPIDHWFRDELKEVTHDVLLDDTAKSRGYFRAEEVSRLVSQHENREFDHSYRLWCLLILEMWQREWIDGG